jgi:hypothetical protein
MTTMPTTARNHYAIAAFRDRLSKFSTSSHPRGPSRPSNSQQPSATTLSRHSPYLSDCNPAFHRTSGPSSSCHWDQHLTCADLLCTTTAHLPRVSPPSPWTLVNTRANMESDQEQQQRHANRHRRDKKLMKDRRCSSFLLYCCSMCGRCDCCLFLLTVLYSL